MSESYKVPAGQGHQAARHLRTSLPSRVLSSLTSMGSSFASRKGATSSSAPASEEPNATASSSEAAVVDAAQVGSANSASSLDTDGDPDAACTEADLQIKRRKMGMWASLKTGYEDLVNLMIRPPRAKYSVEDLGAPEFQMHGRNFRREDIQVRNPRGLLLEGSWWQPVEYSREQLPCVIYMHANASCRLDAIEILPLVLGMGISLFSFDFAGCGLSEGEYISLGFHEKEDCGSVIEHLRGSGRVSTIALWGRSMGSVTALLHGKSDPSIAAMVLDGPFSSLEKLARELIDSAQIKHKPAMVINAVLKMYRKTIKKRTGMDICKLRPIDAVDTCFIPALFVVANDDEFVRPHHAEEIHDRYAGDKNLVRVEGNHNSGRPKYFLDSAGIFIYNRVCVPAGLTEESLGLRPGAPEASVPAYHHAAEDDHLEAELQQALLRSMMET